MPSPRLKGVHKSFFNIIYNSRSTSMWTSRRCRHFRRIFHRPIIFRRPLILGKGMACRRPTPSMLDRRSFWPTIGEARKTPSEAWSTLWESRRKVSTKWIDSRNWEVTLNDCCKWRGKKSPIWVFHRQQRRRLRGKKARHFREKLRRQIHRKVCRTSLKARKVFRMSKAQKTRMLKVRKTRRTSSKRRKVFLTSKVCCRTFLSSKSDQLDSRAAPPPPFCQVLKANRQLQKLWGNLT